MIVRLQLYLLLYLRHHLSYPKLLTIFSTYMLPSIMVQTEGFEPPFATPVTFKELEALLGYVQLYVYIILNLDLILDLIPDLIIDLIPDLIRDLIRDLIPDLIRDLIRDFIFDRFHLI